MEKNKILVTGGCGYIGGHTIVDLIQHGFEVISVDNLSRGSLQMLQGAERIVGKPIKNYKVDLCNREDTGALFVENPDLVGIIHFAAYKSVPESVAHPLLYFRNNLNSLINLLECARDYKVPHFVFSSSCSVYGNADTLPVDEQTAWKEAESPYARTKQIGEQICEDFARSQEDFQTVLLRYFNPVGAHPSGLIGEFSDQPENLVPVITQTAIGKRPSMQVFGADYDTRDGSCIRDYIHVCDIAHAHTRAMEYLMQGQQEKATEVFNLGTGNGVSVLELIEAFETTSGTKLPYKIGPRRAGDVISIYANNAKARTLLDWDIQFDIHRMMETAWLWERNRLKEEVRPNLN